MIRIEDILDKAEDYSNEQDLDQLRRAYVFSAKAHRDQVRRSGEPYLVHPLEVANILVEMRLDAATVATGLLHDVLEDTLTEPSVLERLFGPQVAHLVEGVTKIGKIRFTSREAEQAENFRKMVLAMVDDIRVILVKLADRLHNMRTLCYLAEDKQRRIAGETLDIYAPLANRLGIGKIKGELEDLAFTYLWPQEYALLEQKVEDRSRASRSFIEGIRLRLQEACETHHIPARVDGRVKRLYSIWQKMRRQQVSFEEVYDYLAFRILTESVRDCYAVLGVIHGIWTPIPGRIKDYIAMPKPNLYQSLHTSLMGQAGQPFEVQIRTREMHEIAEEGIAAHWFYKEGRKAGDGETRDFAWLRRLVELGRDVKDPREFLDSLKMDLYPDEVYCFTPKGKVLSFPRGSTAIDFAYAIHSEVGHQCVGCRINGKLVPLRTALRNGDIVEILTDKAQRPSRDWLKIAITTRARSKIRQWLNVEARRRAVDLGRSLLDRAFKRAHLKEGLEEMEASPLLSSLGFSRLEDLHAAVGYGRMEARLVASRVATQRASPELRPLKADAAPPEAGRRRVAGSSEAGIEVTGQGDMLVSLARCCCPIRGDRIVGYITRGRGVTVHSVECRNVQNLLLDPERRIDVNWAGDKVTGTYQVGLRIYTEDRPGMLAKISSRIAGHNTNIKHVEARTFEDRKGLVKLTLEIADLEHLEAICRELTGVEGVIRVTRGLN